MTLSFLIHVPTRLLAPFTIYPRIALHADTGDRRLARRMAVGRPSSSAEMQPA
jgi:hypothetical protein